MVRALSRRLSVGGHHNLLRDSVASLLAKFQKFFCFLRVVDKVHQCGENHLREKLLLVAIVARATQRVSASVCSSLVRELEKDEVAPRRKVSPRYSRPIACLRGTPSRSGCTPQSFCFPGFPDKSHVGCSASSSIRGERRFWFGHLISSHHLRRFTSASLRATLPCLRPRDEERTEHEREAHHEQRRHEHSGSGGSVCNLSKMSIMRLLHPRYGKSGSTPAAITSIFMSPFTAYGTAAIKSMVISIVGNIFHYSTPRSYGAGAHHAGEEAWRGIERHG